MGDSSANYSMEIALNGHSVTVSGPDPEWVRVNIREAFDYSTPRAAEMKQPLGFASGASSITETAYQPPGLYHVEVANDAPDGPRREDGASRQVG